MIGPLMEGTLDAVRYCNLIIRLAREDVEFHAALKFYSGLCGFLVSGSSWTEVQCLTGLCPLWVISGHSARFDRCPLYPRKWSASSASALRQKRTFAFSCCDLPSAKDEASASCVSIRHHSLVTSASLIFFAWARTAFVCSSSLSPA